MADPGPPARPASAPPDVDFGAPRAPPAAAPPPAAQLPPAAGAEAEEAEGDEDRFLCITLREARGLPAMGHEGGSCDP